MDMGMGDIVGLFVSARTMKNPSFDLLWHISNTTSCNMIALTTAMTVILRRSERRDAQASCDHSHSTIKITFTSRLGKKCVANPDIERVEVGKENIHEVVVGNGFTQSGDVGDMLKSVMEGDTP
ncbi:hypothetical protein B0H10DRAFT_1941679 [Mycena sp. CBHHK59/15]|nr:hypothetical protein B0H10DRAFT_1941679 [Mycena sp. CBHHK59/15]